MPPQAQPGLPFPFIGSGDFVFLQQPIKRAAADSQSAGRAGFVVAVPVIRFQHVFACERVQIHIRCYRRYGTRMGTVDNFRWQILDADSVIVGQDLGAIECVLKLPHVAGPTVTLKDRNNVRIEVPFVTDQVLDQQG